MTGYGRGVVCACGIRVEVELSSVNRRQFDAHISLPRCLTAAEAAVNAMIHKAVMRGGVTGLVRVTASGTARPGAIRVNVPLAVEYFRKIRKAAARIGLREDFDARFLLDLPDVVAYESPADDSRLVWPLVKRALRTAIQNLVRMREREGAHLAVDIAARLRRLDRLLAKLKRRAPEIAAHYRRVLRQRLNRAGVPVEKNDLQLAREIALFAERCDITEEIVRLESHIRQARKLLRSRASVGRPLDFLCQEIFREINTLGAKANDGRISRDVIGFKAELETIREQVQNIE